MRKKKQLKWVPGRGVGRIEFGSTLEEVKNISALAPLDPPARHTANWDGYLIPEFKLEVFFENGLLDTIACLRSCTFEGRELIGASVDKVIHLINRPFKKEINGEAGSDSWVFHFPDLDTSVFSVKGVVTEISLSSPNQSDDL